MNTFGTLFRLSIFGESHGPNVGVLLDGVPPGIPLEQEDFTEDINRRRSGGPGTTARQEKDVPHVLSGVYKGFTCGTPLCICFDNEDTRSQDYVSADGQNIPFRPGTADFTGSIKYKGFQDPRGGGHFSGRLTLPLVAAGVVAKKILKKDHPALEISAFLTEVGGMPVGLSNGLLASAVEKADSLGGVVRCRITELPAGWGDPFFNSVESQLSHLLFSIPGVKGVAFGLGFDEARITGRNNPHRGGIAGGITNGYPVTFDVAIKPTPSVGKYLPKHVQGRHDCCFALRVPVVIEATAAIVLADLSLHP